VSETSYTFETRKGFELSILTLVRQLFYEEIRHLT